MKSCRDGAAALFKSLGKGKPAPALCANAQAGFAGGSKPYRRPLSGRRWTELIFPPAVDNGAAKPYTYTDPMTGQ